MTHPEQLQEEMLYLDRKIQTSRSIKMLNHYKRQRLQLTRELNSILNG